MLPIKSCNYFMAKVLHVNNFESQNKIYWANAKFDSGLFLKWSPSFLKDFNKHLRLSLLQINKIGVIKHSEMF